MKRSRDGNVREVQNEAARRQRILDVLYDRLDAMFFDRVQRFSTDDLDQLLADLPPPQLKDSHDGGSE